VLSRRRGSHPGFTRNLEQTISIRFAERNDAFDIAARIGDTKDVVPILLHMEINASLTTPKNETVTRAE